MPGIHPEVESADGRGMQMRGAEPRQISSAERGSREYG